MKQRLPNLFIAGVTKAGTTSLFTYLNAHPDFTGSNVKETQFFKPIYFDESKMDLEKYAKFFDPEANTKYIFEASPIYVNGRERLATYLKRTFPGCKIVIMLRDPATRLVSFFNHCKDLLLIDKNMTFKDYLDECERQMTLAPVPEEAQWQALCRTYNQTVVPWMDVFGEDLWIGYFEDLKRDPAALTDSLCRWLGVPPASEVGVPFTIENATIRPSNVALHRIAIGVNEVLEPFLRRNHGLKRLIRKSYHLVNRSSERGQQPTTADLERVATHFREPNRLFLEAMRAKRPWQAPPPWLESVRSAA